MNPPETPPVAQSGRPPLAKGDSFTPSEPSESNHPIPRRKNKHSFFRPSGSDQVSAARITLVGTVVAAVISVVGAATVSYIGKDDPKPPGETARLTLLPNIVPMNSIYTARADGFKPGEVVRFAWDRKLSETGNPISDKASDQRGQAAIEVREGAQPGMYIIFARGLTSGRTASSALQVVPAPPASLVGSVTTAESSAVAGIEVRITKIDRYSDWLLVLHLSATNKNRDSVDLHGSDFWAVDDMNKSYGIYSENKYTNWRSHVPGGEAIEGTIALNASVDPQVRSLNVGFRSVFTRAGPRDLLIKHVAVPQV